MKLCVTLLGLCLVMSAHAQESLIREEFVDLELWKPLLFPKIEKPSVYDIATDGTNTALRARTDASASGLILKKTFNIRKYPIVKWRWKIDRVFKAGNAAVKKGDDYPIRIYIIFQYDPAKAGLATRAKYGLAKKLYGEYPPHSSLNYIWANRKHNRKIIISPYTSRSRMIPLQAGADNAGIWITESVDIIKDYKKAFGEEPPANASLAIMSDSDNTGEKATAYVDFIQVSAHTEMGGQE